jgi:uncharacterized membrane protein YcaP (DUF421 family)
MNIIELFGEGKDLTPIQMSLRAIVIFIMALIFIRVSGSRSFGIKTPFDNVINILLGAILSRAVVGASPFIATVCASFSIVLIHRIFAWICVYNNFFGKLVKGEPKILYKDGTLIIKNMKHCSVSEKDLTEAIRIKAGKNSLSDIKQACLERNGEISIVPKD